MKKFRQPFAKFMLYGIVLVALFSFLITTCHHDPTATLPETEMCLEQEILFLKIDHITDSVIPLFDSIFERIREMFDN